MIKLAEEEGAGLKDEMLSNEIASLRAQVGSEMSRRNQHVSGLTINLGDIDEEYVPNLKSLRARSLIFERMSNDPQVRGQLRAITMTMISGVRWKVEGGTPAMQELVRANLLGDGDPRLACSSSWLDFLYEAMGCLVYGFSLFGKTWEMVDGRLVLRDLSWLHPRSVDEDGWVMDDADNLVGVRRTYQDATGQSIAREEHPIEDLFIIPWDRRGPNWEGNAFIRPMYRPWLLNEMAEKIDIIDLQNRGVGVPVAHLSGAGGAKERDTLKEILKSLRGGSRERAFIVLEKEEKVGYLLSEGTAKDPGPTLAHHRSNIVKAAGTEYFEQGNTATGSRAGASALATGFFVQVDGIRTVLEDIINRGPRRLPGLVRELIDLNFDNVKEYPRIVGSRVSPTEQLDNIPLIQDSVTKGVIPPHRKLANDVLSRLGYEVMTEQEWDEAMAAKTAFSPAAGGAGRPNEAGPDAEGRDDTEGRRLKMTEKKTLNTGEKPHPWRPAWPWLKSMPD